MTIRAIAYPENSISPYYVSETVDSVQEAIYLLQDNAVLDNYAFVEIRVGDFLTKFHWTEFQKVENYKPLHTKY